MGKVGAQDGPKAFNQASLLYGVCMAFPIYGTGLCRPSYENVRLLKCRGGWRGRRRATVSQCRKC